MTQSDLPQTWSRVIIVKVRPEVDNGRWAIKRTVGEEVTIDADIVTDGHEIVGAEVIYGAVGGEEHAVRMNFLGNDAHRASFKVDSLGRWHYRVRAWIDEFATWLELFERRVKGGSLEAELKSELLEGASHLRHAAAGAGENAAELSAYAARFEAGDIEAAFEDRVSLLAALHDPRAGGAESQKLEIVVERTLARFGSWYEFFPRSAGAPGKHGTLDDAAKRLDYVKEMGFDIVYLPPIHPIGRTFRKGKDNAPEAGPQDPGSPWAIGGPEGGHKTVHPELGGLEAFERFMARAKALELEVALDLAYQVTPDHPYVKEHPEWFRHRPDGSIRYAENPPKKYQDIYPIMFEGKDWQNLWTELCSIVEFWAERGVRTFRVDNPHTKAIMFWEWCFRTLRQTYPDLIFLAEAFTRPKLMYALGKVGFSQSYTYFTWRYTPQEFREYVGELFHTDVSEIYRPNFWPNTPDILPPYLRSKAAFVSRLILASTLSAAYGIYGPVYELMDGESHPAREENKNNEKYEIRNWDLDAPHSLKPLITRINEIRRENPALHHNVNLRFHEVDNEHLLVYSKRTDDNFILVIVNMDLHYTHSGFVTLPLAELGLQEGEPYRLDDLLTGEVYYWEGSRNYVQLDPEQLPAHIFRLRRRVKREQDFDYYM